MVIPEASNMSRTEEVHRITENVYKVSVIIVFFMLKNTNCNNIWFNVFSPTQMLRHFCDLPL